MDRLFDSLVELITETATNLPADVRAAMRRATDVEGGGGQAANALSIIDLNIDMAADNVSPICQDTGMPTFYIHTPVGVNQVEMKRVLRAAVEEATRRGKLRPNSVDSLTGRNSGNNLGPGTPVIHWEQWDEPDIEVRLILKGGGCENQNAQYALPAELEHVGRADRDLEGVYRAVMHAVWRAQGKGCATGFLGVAIGGDRTSGYDLAKQQLFRAADDVNPVPELAELERRIVADSNRLGIGPMGFGGAATIMGCKIAAQNRLPASFFVSIAYECWAYRRLIVRLDPATGAIRSWQFRADPAERMARAEGLATTGRRVDLTAPLDEETTRRLRVGDMVSFNGPVVTGRDAVHKYLAHADAPRDLHGAVLYHCGPVVLGDATSGWKVTAAGPTTSIREEPYQADLLRRFGIRAVIGKGGMGAKTLAALKECGAVYVVAIGGAAQFYADKIVSVDGVHFLDEFGAPEAMWEFTVRDFVGVVTMDSTGASLHADIEMETGERLEQLVS